MDLAVPQPPNAQRTRTADEALLSPQGADQSGANQPSRQRTGSPFAGYTALTNLKDDVQQKFTNLEQQWLQRFQELEQRIDAV